MKLDKHFLIIISLFIVTITYFIYPQTNQTAGIKFNSKNGERSKKTSIFLNDGKSIKLENSFSISFDVSFWTCKYFGTILRIENESKNEISVVYNQHIDEQISYIQIIESSYKKQIEIPFPQKELQRNKWYEIKLSFDKNNNEVKIYVNDSFKDRISYQIKKQIFFDFVFGIKDWNNPHDYDIPGISIKNILITENNERKYFWSLNPLAKNVYEDIISGLKLKLINPIWVYEDSKIWKKLVEVRTSDHYSSHLGVAYDSTNSRLIIDGREDLYIYDLITAKDSVIKYRKTSPAFWNDLFYNPDKQILYSYFTAMGKVSIYDLRKNEWTNNDPSKDDDGHYFGSAKFSHPKSDDLFLLGGYGMYKVNNDLFKYSFIKKEWEKVKLKKNEMTPRAWFTFGKGFNDGEYLIYGGIGNETGEQEHGLNPYYDLFLLNINDSTITKLKLPQTRKFQYSFLFNDLYLDKKDSSIYFLSQNDEGKSFPVSLNKLDLKTGNVFPVGNKFWEISNGHWIYAHLHYNKSTNEFISVLFDTTTVEVFSINYPPISESIRTYTETEISDSSYLIIILSISTLIAVIALGYFFIRKKKRNTTEKGLFQNINEETIHLENQNVRNSIQLFGGFDIYDNEGRNIILDFSPKLKEIMLLILLRSFNHYQHKGITSEELSSIIWPDASPESVKSNRGVAINKIRKLLSSIDGLELEFVDKRWFIKMNNGASCDYSEFVKLNYVAKNRNDFTNNSFLSITNTVEGGEFLKGVSYGWLDPIKFSVNSDIIKFLKQHFDNEEVKSGYEKILKLCEIILTFDSVDEEVIKIKIRTLLSQGKYNIAKSSYKLFVAEYKKLYDEHYPVSFEEIISTL